MGDRPLQGGRVPRIGRSLGPMPHAPDNVPDKGKCPDPEADCTDRANDIEWLKLLETVIDGRVGDASHHASKTEIMHWEEGQVEEHEGHPEMDPSKRVVEHPTRHFGKPEVDRCEDRKHAAAEEDVVEVGDDEVGMVDEEIDRGRGHEDAAEPTDHEHRDEGHGEGHRHRVMNRTAPDGSHPVEGFDRARHRNDHR